MENVYPIGQKNLECNVIYLQKEKTKFDTVEDLKG